MKNTFRVFQFALIGITLLFSSVAFAQEPKVMTHEEMKTISKGMFDVIECDVYVAKDGHSYKVGDTLKIGRPSTNKTFAYLWSGGVAAALAGQEPTPLTASQSGNNAIIKKLQVGGTKRAGFKMSVIAKGLCAICGNILIDFEQALETGEIQSLGMTREQAIAKLKEAKDLVDLGMMSKEDFEKLKTELTPLIMKQ